MTRSISVDDALEHTCDASPSYVVRMRIEADGVLFDNDGVLVDSESHVDAAWRQLASEFGLDTTTLGAERSGVRAIDTLGRHLRGVDLVEAVERLEHLEVELAAQVRALPGAIALCRSLPPGSWAIVTSASRRLALARWAGAGIPVPGSTVTADDVDRGKPDPEPYSKAASLLGLDSSRCVVFEDSASGAESARRAGAAPIAVGSLPWAFDPIERITDLSAVAIATGTFNRLILDLDSNHS